MGRLNETHPAAAACGLPPDTGGRPIPANRIPEPSITPGNCNDRFQHAVHHKELAIRLYISPFPPTLNFLSSLPLIKISPYAVTAFMLRSCRPPHSCVTGMSGLLPSDQLTCLTGGSSEFRSCHGAVSGGRASC